MRRLLLVCFTLVLPAAVLCAQDPTHTSDQQKFKLSGSVVNAVSGEPVRGAHVQMFGAQSGSVMAGSDGRFEISNLAAGTVILSAQRPGFAPMNQQQAVVGSALENVTIKLNPLARISGRILDRDGEPIEGVNVQCLHELLVNGRKQWQPTGGGSSDEMGRFLLEDLEPGGYMLYTIETPLYHFTRPKSEAARYIYPQTFYPDAPARESAQRINVAAGEDMKIDMSLHSIRGVRVTFTTDPPSQNVMASIGNGDQRFMGRGAQVDPSGVLSISGVSPGSWQLTVRGPFSSGRAQNEQPMFGEIPIEVNTADIENLKVPLNKLPDIPVLIAGGATAGIYLQLVSKNGEGAGMGSQIDQTGALQIPSVQPGTYRVTVQPRNACIHSMTSGSVDLLRDELVVPAGASVPPIQIEKGQNCASLSLTANAKTPTNIIVTSDAKGFEPQSYQTTGEVTVDGLPDGEYTVYAIDDITNLEYTNPEAMRDFKSQTVRLEAGQKTSLQLEVNERHAR